MRQMRTHIKSLQSIAMPRLYDIFNEHRPENNVSYPTLPTAFFKKPVNRRLSYNSEVEICEKTTKKIRMNAVK